MENNIKEVEREEMDLCGSGLEPGTGLCEHFKEPSGSVKGKALLNSHRIYFI